MTVRHSDAWQHFGVDVVIDRPLFLSAQALWRSQQGPVEFATPAASHLTELVGFGKFCAKVQGTVFAAAVSAYDEGMCDWGVERKQSGIVTTRRFATLPFITG